MLCHTVENDSLITKLFVNLLLILPRKAPFMLEGVPDALQQGHFCCGDSYSYNYHVVQQ